MNNIAPQVTTFISMNPFPIYVIHYTRAPERKRFIEGELDANRLSAIFIEDYDREDLTDSVIRQNYDPSPSQWRDMIAVSRRVLIENGQFKMAKRSWSQDVRAKHGRGKYAGFLDYRELNATQISIAIKHLTVYRRMLDAGQACALVLEDDAIFDRQFAAAATEVLARVPSGWDFIGIGEGCGLRVPERHPDEIIYRMRPPRTNCTGAYFISERFAAALISRGKPFTWPIDWLMQYIMTTDDLACYWRDPPLVGHGSETGLFPSTTRQARLAIMDQNAASHSDQHPLTRRLANTVAKARRLVQWR